MAKETRIKPNAEWAATLSPLLDAYKTFLQSPEYNELYKWQIAKSVQDNWDVKTKDLAGMIETCFGHTQQNLWAGAHYFPKAMLLGRAVGLSLGSSAEKRLSKKKKQVKVK